MSLTCSKELMSKKGRSFNYSCQKTLRSFCVTAVRAVVHTVCLRSTVTTVKRQPHDFLFLLHYFTYKSPSPSLFVCVMKRHLKSSGCRLSKWVTILLAWQNNHMKAKLVCVEKQSRAVAQVNVETRKWKFLFAKLFLNKIDNNRSNKPFWFVSFSTTKKSVI